MIIYCDAALWTRYENALRAVAVCDVVRWLHGGSVSIFLYLTSSSVPHRTHSSSVPHRYVQFLCATPLRTVPLRHTVHTVPLCHTVTYSSSVPHRTQFLCATPLRTVPLCHTVHTVPLCHTLRTVPLCHTLRTVPLCHTVTHSSSVPDRYVKFLCATPLRTVPLCGSQNKQQLFPYTALTDWFS